jgi:beta-glucosidase/6-phospho-beta-glucosidase/beta-galactosidase
LQSTEFSRPKPHTPPLDFITGFPGHEHELRRALLEVLGQEKYDYFFERFLAYFFTSEDAKFLKSLGLNCVRIPINHRYLMDDLNPDTIKQDGFKLIDTIVDVCAAEGLYTIIDLHTFPGGQSMSTSHVMVNTKGEHVLTHSRSRMAL